MYEETRVRLAKALRRDRVPDPVWDNLLERDLVQDYEKGEFEWEYLVDQTRIQLKAYNQTLAEANVRDSSGTDTMNSSKEVEPELGVYEKDRAEALGEYLALRASLDSHVRYFRKVVLGGELLTPEQARIFRSVRRQPVLRHSLVRRAADIHARALLACSLGRVGHRRGRSGVQV
jgi:hypothetical protein